MATLVIRLVQTSVMVLFKTQATQLNFACVVALVSVCLQREVEPFQHASDNRIALGCCWLLFCWVFALQADLSRVLGKLFVGITLLLATIALAEYGVGCIIVEVRELIHSERDADSQAQNGNDGAIQNEDDAAEHELQEIIGGGNASVTRPTVRAPPPVSWDGTLSEMQDSPGGISDDSDDDDVCIAPGCIELTTCTV